MKEFKDKSFACVLDKGDISLLMIFSLDRKIHQAWPVSPSTADFNFLFVQSPIAFLS